MAFRIEWRRRSEGDDTILVIEEGSNDVVKTWQADTDLLQDFLNDMVAFDPSPAADGDRKTTNGVDSTHRSPQAWGELVMARAEDGEVLRIEPGPYWEGIAFWFRSRGRDPHPARRR